jgi:hypothetical protein
MQTGVRVTTVQPAAAGGIANASVFGFWQGRMAAEEVTNYDGHRCCLRPRGQPRDRLPALVHLSAVGVSSLSHSGGERGDGSTVVSPPDAKVLRRFLHARYVSASQRSCQCEFDNADLHQPPQRIVESLIIGTCGARQRPRQPWQSRWRQQPVSLGFRYSSQRLINKRELKTKRTKRTKRTEGATRLPFSDQTLPFSDQTLPF